ncbi:hypothetical protein B1F74_03575 [Pseudomonas syringae]|nr:hypothetical protein B1F74_03575 [Pseudomonas syringae]
MKKGVSERCMRVDSLLNEQQAIWAGRWCLMADFVVCSHCLIAQPIDMADQSFEHSPDCDAKSPGLHPWHELRVVLNQIQGPKLAV